MADKADKDETIIEEGTATVQDADAEDAAEVPVEAEDAPEDAAPASENDTGSPAGDGPDDGPDNQAAAQPDEYDLSYTQNRELSWLRFDGRVLDEATDESVPLYERIKFVSIFESNLVEFFMVRVGGLSDLAMLKHQPVDNKSGLTPSEQLDLIFETLPPMIEKWQGTFHSLESSLSQRGVTRLETAELTDEDRETVQGYFTRYIQPIISPLVIDPRHPFPNLRNGTLYLVCTLTGMGEEGLMGLVEIPPMLPRVVELPSGEDEFRYTLVEDVVQACLESCFGPYTPSDPVIIRVVRSADIDPDGEGVEEEEDYRQHMKKVLKKRLRLKPICMFVRGNASKETLKFLRRVLALDTRSIIQTDIPLDLDYVYAVEGHIPAASKEELLYEPFSPQASPLFRPGRTMREQVYESDKLLFYPYESMNALLELVNEAAHDDECISIRITLYRVAKQSRLCESLISAAEHGKEVTVLMELRARFDEENNIEWAERLEEAGCTVIYGSEGFKCHSKICLITYRTSRAIERITLLGTGNFNEKTAKLYSDFMLMTADSGIGMDGNAFFRNLSLGNLNGEYQYLGVSPTSLKPLIMDNLDRQIELAREGQPARAFLKMNSLTDRDVIDKISEASCAGVRVDMVIRGICCLLPGIPGKTENVHVRSIVGRYLEHARVYAFGVEPDTVYLSSADMMTRNTEHRVEIAFPVLDETCRKMVLQYMNAQLRDNTKARELASDGTWHHVERAEGEADFNAQEYLMELATERAAEAERKVTKEATARPKVPATRVQGSRRRAGAARAMGKAMSNALANVTISGKADASEAATQAQGEADEPGSTDAEGAIPNEETTGTDESFTESVLEAADAAVETTPETEGTETWSSLHTTPSQAHVEATIIEPEPEEDADATQGAAVGQSGDKTSAGVRRRSGLAKRQPGRVATGLSFIGYGLKTLIFGPDKKK